MFIFALANGTLEAVANPLVATLFPNNRTHYLNILHASWPAGLVLGALAGWVLGDRHALGLEGPTRALSRPDRALRRHVLRPALPEIRSRVKGRQARRNVQGRRHPRRLGHLRPARSVLQRLFRRPYGGCRNRRRPRLRRWRGAADRDRRHHALLHRLDPACSFCSSRTRWSARSNSARTAGFKTSPATSSRRRRANGSSSAPPRSCSACASARTSSRRR